MEGCSQWHKEGLLIPDVVREATDSYRIDLDPLKEFTEECCIKGGRTSCKDAFNAYALWAKENHLIRPLGRNNFTTRMEAKGYVRKREGHRFWEGFHLEV